LLLGEVNYDHFLAQTSQCVAVDCAAASRAFVVLFQDPDLRRRMGEAGRRRAVQDFDWRVVIRAYENLWRTQEVERAVAAASASQVPRHPGTAAYPAPERSFAGYPTLWLDDDARLAAPPDALGRLTIAAHTPLTNHASRFRVTDLPILSRLLKSAGDERSIAELLAQLTATGTQPIAARATLAWLLKYDLLRPLEDPQPRP
jgi:hypothetical protein